MSQRHRQFLIIITAVLCDLGSPVIGAIHKCTDADGKVSFSDTACPSGSEAESMDIPSGPSKATGKRSNESYPSLPIEPSTFLDQRQNIGRLKQEPSTSATYRKWKQEELDATRRAEMLRKLDPRTGQPRVSRSGAVNSVTGEYLAPSGEGYVGTRDGRYYAPAGPNGVIDTRTGKFVPMH
jgi:hypothetical protein